MSDTSGSGGSSVRLEPVVDGLETPMALAFPPGRSDRMYVAEREGRIRVRDSEELREEPLLDIEDRVLMNGEQGLLGMALHPGFGETRKLYVRYSGELREDTPDPPERIPDGYSHTSVLAEFEVDDEGFHADPDSERAVMEVPQPHENHNAGDLAFGPDGSLYVPLGDGGGGYDRGAYQAPDWYGEVEGGNGQNVSANLHGGVHRIDVEEREERDHGEYGIPESNPLVGRDGYDEYFAWGFRNPWRMAFDGGGLFVCDVGADHYEEINAVRRGGNYGWNVREGAHCLRAEDCPDSTPEEVRDGEPLLDPVIEYPNARNSNATLSGFAVVCGRFYRKSDVPGLAGKFVFSDWQARWRLFAATPSAEGRWPLETVEVENPGALDLVYGFERGPTGDMYVLAHRPDSTGVVHRIAPGGEG